MTTAFDLAKARYAAQGVDVEKALTALSQIPISIHCWQGDDVTGFRTRERCPFRRYPDHGQLSRQGARRPRS